MAETPDRTTRGIEPVPALDTDSGLRSRHRVLPNWQIRVLCLGLALAQLVTGAPLWLARPVATGTTAHYWLTGLSAVVALTVILLFIRAWVVGGPVERFERNAVIALAVNPVLMMVVGLAIPVSAGIREFITYAENLVYVTSGLTVLHAIPAFIVTFVVHRRIGTSDVDWKPHLTDRADNGFILLGLSIMTGGWTAALGLIATGILYIFFGFVPIDALGFYIVVLAIAQGFGMVLGLFAGIVSSTIPASTRLDRSVPRIFLPAMGAGVIGSAVFPLLGILAASITLLIMCLVTRRTCRLYPEGHCQKCNYHLAGLAEPVCPECGTRS